MAYKNITDLENSVIQWAWQMLKITKDKLTKNFKFTDLKFEVNWKRTSIITEKPEFTEKQMKDNAMKNVVFKSVYENRTDVAQEHHFSTERCTVSKCKTNITEGFSRGISLGLTLGLPNEVMSATACYGREITIATEDENEVEEVMAWSANSVIQVQPHHKSRVVLDITEREFNAKFIMMTRIKGHVTVSILNRKENNALLETVEGEMSEIFQSQMADFGNATLSDDCKTVLWRVTGTCDFVFGVEQRVFVEEESIDERLLVAMV